MLNKRLLACAEYVQGNFVCDVGTDHAQLPIYLVQEQIIRKAIACDIREGPLQAAEQNIRKAGLSEQIQIILSDGLQNIRTDGLTDIVIAGMGGETMIHILETCPFSLKDKHLILQPMTKAELLRKWLFAHGFPVRKETCVRDGHFLYAVMQADYTGMKRIPDFPEMYFGQMNLSQPDCHAYAERIIAQLHKANFHEDTQISEIISRLEERLNACSCQ